MKVQIGRYRKTQIGKYKSRTANRKNTNRNITIVTNPIGKDKSEDTNRTIPIEKVLFAKYKSKEIQIGKY